MSNYRALAYHPTSGRLEVATWVDTGRAGYVVHFARESGGLSMGVGSVRQPDPVELFEIAQAMANVLDDVAGMESWLPDDGAALSRWQQFTNAKETAGDR